MSTITKRNDSPYYWYNAAYKGRRIRISTNMRSKKRARAIQLHYDMKLAKDELDFISDFNQSQDCSGYRNSYLISIGNFKSSKACLVAEGALDKFVTHLLEKNILMVNEVTYRIVQDYISDMDRAVQTKKNHLNEIKLFFDEAIREELIRENPAKLVRLPKGQKKNLHRLLVREDFRVIGRFGHPWLLYYQALYFTGMRAGDVAMLKLGDISIDSADLTSLIRKSGKIYEMPLSKFLLNEIPIGGAPDTALFPDLYSEHEDRLNERFRVPRQHLQAILRANNRPKATLHSFRVTFNNHLRDLGLKIEDRQKLLAHSSSETTKIYTHPNKERAREFIDKLGNPFEDEDEG